MRRNNLARIVRRLHTAGPATRSELVAITGLNRSTVGALVTELASLGLVREETSGGGSVGRPSLRVAPVDESCVVLAFDLRVDRTLGAVVGLGGGLIARHEQRHGRRGFGLEGALRQIEQMTEALLAAAPDGAAWVGTGVSVPGIVDHADGGVRLAPNLGWVDVPLGRMLDRRMQERFGDAPTVVIGNDADLGALAEHARGAAAGNQNMVFINGDIGIGGGIIVDGRPMSGAGGFAGEVGHMVVNPTGRVCRCGRRGCWETEIGRDAIALAVGRSAERTDVAQLIREAEHGNTEVLRGLEQVNEWLALGVANIVNAFNPDVVLLGGNLRLLLPHAHKQIDDALGAVLPGAREQVRVVAPILDGDSAILGAAEAAFQPMLADPAGVFAESGTLISA